MKLSILLYAALAAPLFVYAEEPAKLDPVVITATGTENKLSDSLASISVITRDQIERAQATDVAELLRFTAGVELGRSGGIGQQTSVFIRGANSAHTLVLIDGERINRLTAGGATFENISPEMIERIEIVKGPRATLYGSDAIGGVINIITRHAQKSGGDFYARGGTHETIDGSLHGAYVGDASHLSARAQHQETSGIPAVAGLTQSNSFRQNSFNLEGATQAGPVQLAARAWYSQARAQYFAFNPATFLTDLPASHDLHNLSVAADASMKLAEHWQSTLTLAHAQDRIDERQSADYLHNDRPSLAWHNVFAPGDIQRISFGAEAAVERVDAISSGAPIYERRQVYSAFAQDELDAGAHHALAAISGQHNQAYGNRFNWNAEYGYDLFAATRVFATAGTAFHAPTAFDRYAGFGGSPNLRPETSTSYEVGARQKLGDAQSVELRLFRNDIKNLIEYPPPAFTATNIGRARNQGIEATYRVFAGGFSGEATGTLQNPRDRDTGASLARRSRAMLGARLAQDIGHGYVALDTLAQGHRADIDLATFGPMQDAGYALLNLATGWRFGTHFRIDARAENLLDRHYQTVAGYNQVGAAFFGSLRCNF